MRQLTFALLAAFLSISSFAQQDCIDSFIVDQMKRQHIVGLSVGIVKNGSIVKAAGYGKANIELNVPVSAKTVFKIGSLSKQFIAVAVMELAQGGKLSIDDPIANYVRNAPQSWKSITIRHLLNHTSGLPADPPGFEGMKALPDSVYITRAFKNKLSVPPGTKFEYSNFGYYVLADIIRIVSHQSFPEYMTQNVFNAVGLNATRTTSVEALVRERASGYIEDSVQHLQNAPNYVAVRPSGAFLSNINDLLTWEMAMQHGKLFNQHLWNKLWYEGFNTSLSMDKEPIYYGFGWMVNTVGEDTLVHHGGSLPGFKSVYFRYLEKHTAIIILTKSDQTDAYAIAFGIADLLKR
jgi:CubicO group peptidase (beta-lactamase class C family)